MSCHYKNGVEGYCAPENSCPKEQQEIKGYNGPWKCPYHADRGSSQICCLYPGEENLLSGEENLLSGEENLLPGEEKTLDNLKKLCGSVFFFTTKKNFGFLWCDTCV